MFILFFYLQRNCSRDVIHMKLKKCFDVLYEYFEYDRTFGLPRIVMLLMLELVQILLARDFDKTLSHLAGCVSVVVLVIEVGSSLPEIAPLISL